MALKVGELFASFNLDTSGIGSALNGAEKSLSSAGKSLAVGGAAVTAAVTAPLIAAGKDIAKKGSEFDAQMSKVFAIAGDEVTGSAEAMEKLRAKALEMGSTTQFTATEAGEAFEYMAMAGWKTESMLSAIEPLMNLAAAAGADLGTTSDIVTDAMTAFGLKATDMMTVVKDGVQMSVPAVEYFADILAATSTNSNTNVTMLGESFKYVAPLAGSFGYSLNDVSLALGLMANNGIKSTMAGTSLSRVIQNMTKPSKETKEAMSALGLSLYDAKGQMKPLREVMNDFRGVAKKNGIDVSKLSEDVAKLSDKLEKGEITEKQYEKELAKLTDGSGDFMKYVTQIAGARGLPGLLAIMNASQEDFDSLAKSIDNATGSSKKMKDVMLDNMKGDLTIFKSAVEGLEITLWDLVKEPMRGLVQRGTQIVDKFRNMDKSTQKGALRMAAFAAAIGPAMTAAGGLLTVLPKIRKVLLGLASPVGLVSIGLLALGAAAMDADNLMGQNLEKMANTAKTKLQDLQKNLLGKHLVLSGRANRFLGSVQRAITTAVPGIVDAVSGLLQTGLAALTDVLPEAAKTATTMVSTLASGIARNAPQLTKTLAGTLTSLATSVISAVPEMLDAGVKLFSALIDSLGKVNWKEIGTKINTAVTDALKEIKTNFYALVFGKEPTEEDLGDWGPLGAKLVENIKAGIKTASQNGKNLIGSLVLGSDYNPDESWTDVAVKIWNKITGKMGEYLKNAGQLIKGMVLGSDYKPDASWSSVAVKAWKIIKDKFTALKSNAKNLIGQIVLGSDYDPGDSWKTVAVKAWKVIQNKFKELKTGAKNLIGEIVLGGNYDPGTSWETIATAIWEKAKAKFAELKANAHEIIGQLALGEGYTADSTWGDIGSAIWETIKAKLAELGKNAKDLIGKLTLGSDYSPDATSWGAIAVKIWKIIQDKFAALKQNVKNLIGKLALGSDYTPETTWAQVGEKIWNVIKSGITAAGDWIKQLVLGENYTPDASWSTVGSAIWAKIKTGFTAVGDWVKRLVMGKDYTPDNTWSDVGKKIWDRIKSGITVTGDWLKTKLGYTPSDSWTTVGSGIWKKIKSGISDKGDWLKTKLGYNATDDWKTVGSGILAKIKEGIGTAEAFAASILEKIGTVDIDVEKVQAVVKNAGAFVTGLVGKMLNGKIEWGSKITGVAAKIAEQLRTFDWSGVGTDLGMSAANMVRGMIDMIPKAVDAAGKALDLGAELAGGILTSVVTGIKTLAAEGAGNKLGDAATELLHGILTGISDFGNNENVKTFVTNLGDGIRSAMGMLGDVCGKMIAYIFSADGIRAIYNAGVTVLDVILQGMAAGIGGVMSFFSNMFDNILIQAGLIDPKARDAANAAGAELANALTAGAESELSKGMRGQNLMTLMQYALTHGGQGGQFDGKWSLDDNLNMALNSMLDTQGKTVEEFKQNFMDLWMEEHAFFNSGDFTEFWKDLFPEWKDFDDNSLKEHVGELFEEYDSIAEIVKSKLGPDYWSHYFTDDMGFWEAMYNALSSGDTTALMQLMSSQAALLFGDNTTKAADEEDKVVKEAMTKLYGDTAESVQEGAAQVKQSVVDSMSDTANAFGKEGFEKALKDNTEPVKTAAAEVSDAAVKEFLLTMSEENGYLIGDNFVLALGFGMSGQTDTLKQTAVSVARSGYTSMSQTANYNMGYSIGSNFGRGFVNGIRAMIDEAAQAAAELGAAGTAGLSGSIQEGSPSKITAMSGTNFGLGFVNSILLMADQAADAAREMGVEALSALDYTARDMGRTAIDQTDMKQRSAYTRTAEAAREARGGSADMQELTDRIVTALEKVGVYIDGEEAGHLLTRYISEEIAEGASARR